MSKIAKITTKQERTVLAGASDERDAVLARLRRRAAHFGAFYPAYNEVRVELERNIAWLLARSKRYDKRKGGLGR